MYTNFEQGLAPYKRENAFFIHMRADISDRRNAVQAAKANFETAKNEVAIATENYNAAVKSYDTARFNAELAGETVNSSYRKAVADATKELEQAQEALQFRERIFRHFEEDQKSFLRDIEQLHRQEMTLAHAKALRDNYVEIVTGIEAIRRVIDTAANAGHTGGGLIEKFNALVSSLRSQYSSGILNMLKED